MINSYYCVTIIIYAYHPPHQMMSEHPRALKFSIPIIILLLFVFSMASPISETSQLKIEESSGTSIANSPGFQTGSIFSPATFSSGGQHNCLMTESQEMYCWGSNNNGQLGNSSSSNSYEEDPLIVDFSSLSNTNYLDSIYAVSAGLGKYHTCAVMNNGSISCWGANSYGQLGIGSNVSSPPTLVDIGLNNTAVAITAGKSHTCIIDDNASVLCWGYNNHGQLGDGTTTDRQTPVSVNLGANRSAVAISAGESHTCVITDNESIMCWGYNNHGQLGDGTFLSKNSPITVSVTNQNPVVSISSGRHHTCVLFSDSTVGCWGWNDRGQLGDGTTTSQSTMTMINVNSNMTALTTGDKHSCAILDNASLMCWGDNLHGQLGINSTTNNPNPQFVLLNQSMNVVGITSGSSHTCAVTTSKTSYCWGQNNVGQLGDGSTSNSLIPVSTVLYGESILLGDRDIDGDGILNIFDTHGVGDEDGDGVPIPDDIFPNNPARSISCSAGEYGRYFCLDADVGHFVSEPGQVGQVPCDFGTYQPSTGQINCLDSQPGHHVDMIASVLQEPCLVGMYQPLSAQQFCLDSQPGYYVNSTGSSNQTACDLGEYQSNSAQASCIIATPGHYVDTIASSTQTPCLAGSYNPSTGSNDSSACLLADLGNYTSQSGMSYQIIASPGYYVDTIGSDHQTPCLAGSYNPDTGSNNSSACLLADLGYYVNSQARSYQTAAQPGNYVDTVGATDQTPCLAGSYNPDTASIASSDCLLADLGYYVSSPGSPYQTSAQPGYYVNSTGATEQTPCSAGHYNPLPNAISVSSCLPAQAGHIVPSEGRSYQSPCGLGEYQSAVGQISCIATDPGYYTSGTGNSAQTPCAPGYYNNQSSATSCELVPKGTYAEGEANVDPTNCPTGTSTISLGSNSPDDCITDTDGDLVPDQIDTDDDNDGVTDIFDDFPTDSAEQTDTDDDGIGDNADTDDDGDGVFDVDDPFPYDSSEYSDNDEDGIGDNTDDDDDDDGWLDVDEETCGSNPLNATSLPIDFDSDQICDVMDGDDDGDLVPDPVDTCPGHDDRLDWDDDGIPDGCDSDMDIDGDGLTNDIDMCDFTPLSERNLIDENGCGPTEWADDDHDGVPNSIDLCTNTPSSETPNSNGCGASQRDSDNDGWIDSIELLCGSDPLDSDDKPISDCSEKVETTDGGDTDSASAFGALSCWILPILIIIAVLVVLLIIGSSRDEDGKFVININKIKYTVSSLVNKEKEESNSYDLLSDDLTPINESQNIDDWDDESTPFIPPTDDSIGEADAKMAEMDAKMAEMDAKMAELNEKEAQLARIAEKADTIDFDTIGVATSSDSDNLIEISGIGEFIVEKLNALGIYQYQQIANMTPEIEDQVNEAIEFFPGRIKRDNWVGQAAELAGSNKKSIDQIDDDDEWFE